jgi:hypothetical protein
MSARRTTCPESTGVDLVGALESGSPAHRDSKLGRVVAHEAIAAVDLHVLVEHVVSISLAATFRIDASMANSSSAASTSSRGPAQQGAVDQAGRPIEHRLDGELADGHLGELVPDRKRGVGCPN